ncbi:MAG: hypothetical protein H6506_05165 [Calditrichaeota bacterium]|nr:hypothetical protein [Calditrichota bacterium]MCB9392026.1 hypothetical protein [Calditrichota bacterium]
MKLLPFLLLLFSALLFAQQNRGSVELRRADALSYGEENGAKYQKLSGNVEIGKDSLSITCELATYFPDSGLLYFTQEVVVHDGQRTMLADEVTYLDWLEEVHARGRVRIYQDSIKIHCDRALYHERLKNGFLYDNVRVRYDARQVTLTGGLGYFDHEENSAWMTQRPVLVRRDSLGNAFTEITGDTIAFADASGMARAVGSVKVVRDSLTAFGEILTFFTDSSFAELTGDPLALSAADSIQGDSMLLFFDGEVLERVEVHGHAHATSPADTVPGAPRQILTGQMMTLWIENSLLSRALVEGTATATYFIRDDQGAQGLNVTSGDRLAITFSDRKISRIRVQGGTEGKYTPESLVNSAHSN